MPEIGLSLVLACGVMLAPLSSGAQTFFTDVTDEIGVPLFGARSIAFGDYDNDGWPDLFLSEHSGGGTTGNRIALLHNEGDGRFTDVTPLIQADMPTNNKGGGASFGDYDNDGDLDLYVPVGGPHDAGPNLLLQNEQGAFVDVADAAGLSDAATYSDNMVWLDYDRDGLLDVYVAGWPMNALYRNNGDGAFVDVTIAAGLAFVTDPDDGDRGSSNGGIGSADFNEDGWPDLYLGVFSAANRLLLSDGEGGYWDATSGEIGDPGEAFGVAIGDINGDLHLDIYQAGGGWHEEQRSSLLQNLGGGTFLDVTESSGLGSLVGGNMMGVGLGDIDNDGDLDLLIPTPHHLLLNNGDGTFLDVTERSGIGDDLGLCVSFGDYDLDGDLDVALGSLEARGRLYRNEGGPNHWLRVELVGTRSNRSGIGARLTTTTGDLRQVREILGGLGHGQHELPAHFGLGQRTRVDSLVVQWPSGQVDVLTEIPSDGKIRVVEGQGEYREVHPTVWQTPCPDSLVVGQKVGFTATVRPTLVDDDARVVRATADLSPFGGPSELPLTDGGDGTYQLSVPPLDISGPNGIRLLSVLIEQTTSRGPTWTRLTRGVRVLPAEEMLVFTDTLVQPWKLTEAGLTSVSPQEDAAHTGAKSLALEAKPGVGARWRVGFAPDAPVSPVGYALRLAFHPGESTKPTIGKAALDLELVTDLERNYFGTVKLFSGRQEGRPYLDLAIKDWQVIEIPLEIHEQTRSIAAIRLSGTVHGRFYLDDIRLVAAPGFPVTAIVGDHSGSSPSAFTLDQNYPNPFNSSTTIRFSLPQPETVELTIYNLAGQQVTTLASGPREAGAYTLRWDGRDDEGRELASGVYLYRLQAGEQVETRKLLLMK